MKAMLDGIKEKKAKILAEGGDPKQNFFLKKDSSMEDLIEDKTPELAQNTNTYFIDATEDSKPVTP